MGIYRDYKSHKDPKKFLERFSKNISSDISVPQDMPIAEEERKYEIPAARSAMDYVILKKKCQEFLLGIIQEEDFRRILEVEKERLRKFSKGFDNFNFKSKGLSWERELQIKNLFLKSAKEYDAGLKDFEDYIDTGKKSLINSGIQFISSAGEKLIFIRKLSEKDRPQIIEEMKNYYDHSIEEPSVPDTSSPAPVVFVVEKKADLLLLSSFPVFSDLSPSDMDEIGLLINMCDFPKDHILYQEGMECDRVYIVVSGELVICKSVHLSPDKSRIFAHAGRGDILGDMGVIDGGPQATDARILSEKAELYFINREDFLSLLQRYPRISLNLNKIYCVRMRDILQKLLDK